MARGRIKAAAAAAAAAAATAPQSQMLRPWKSKGGSKSVRAEPANRSRNCQSSLLHISAVHTYFAPHMPRWEFCTIVLANLWKVVIEHASEIERILDNHHEYGYPENPLTCAGRRGSHHDFIEDASEDSR
ncbi:hypothetical protein ALC53_06319 [Atta colombica]|uniref:Uncharacterized protein n=1 Tax=Atta colombica TaxID=520822 RepID=A0A195BFR9_9HYME|nr:hypothetical protein ALC53_06319 [Atta colombica]